MASKGIPPARPASAYAVDTSRLSTGERKALRGFQQRLAGRRNTRTALSEARSQLSPALYGPLLAWAQHHDEVKQLLFPAQFAASPAALHRFTPPIPVNLRRELRWATAYLRPFSEQLRAFAVMAREYDGAVLTGDSNLAGNVLDQCEAAFGSSVWLVRNRIAQLQAQKGLEAQKTYISELRQHSARYGLVPFVGYYVSVLNEPSVTSARFDSQHRRRFAELSLQPDIDILVRYHVLGDQLFSESECALLLSSGVTGSVIDYYETVLTAARCVVTRRYEDCYEALSGFLSTVGRETEDSRLGGLNLLVNGDDSFLNVVDGSIEAFEAMLIGDTEKCASLAQQYLRERSDAFDLWIALAIARSDARTVSAFDGDVLLDRIVSRMAAVIGKHQPIDTAADELTKLAMIYSGRPWADLLGIFVTRERAAFDDFDADERAMMAAICQEGLQPRLLFYFRGDTAQNAYLAALRKRHGPRLAVEHLAAAVSHETGEQSDSRVTSAEQSLLQARRALRGGRLEEASRYVDVLLASDSRYHRNRGVRFRVRILLQQRLYGEAVRFAVAAVLGNRELRHVLPLGELAGLANAEETRALVGDLALPILFHLAYRFVDVEYDIERKNAYEDLLGHYGLARPSGFSDLREKFDRPQLVFFLRHVCVPAVMDTSTVFSSSEEVANERLSVCRALAELDSDRIEEYQTEIKSILRDLTLKRRIREIERSKIYVDIEGVRRAATDAVRESYSRYIEFVRLGLASKNPAGFAAVLDDISSRGADAVLALELPASEPNDLLERIIRDVRDIYALSPEYGLERYLSTRIRHGTLAGQLRQPLEQASLITKRDAITRAYAPNAYWMSRLGGLDRKTQDAARATFETFSREFDDLLELMLVKWVRVKTTPGQAGLFEFVLSPQFIRFYSEFIAASTTLDDFLRLLLDQLTQNLDARLDVIRQVLIRDAKQRVNEALNTLQKNVHRIYSNANLTQFDAALNTARTEMQLAFDRVIDWFQLWKATSQEPFTLAEAIDVGRKSVQLLHPQFDVEATVDEGERRVHGSQFAGFVDVFFILFENIVRHAGIQPAKASVAVTYPMADKVSIRVENAVDPSVISPINEAKIGRIKAAMASGAYRDSITSEGGTGFHKMWTILQPDPSHSSVDFGFFAEGFFVEFALPFKEISVADPDR